MNRLNAEKKQKSLSFVVLKIFDFYFCPDTYASPVSLDLDKHSILKSLKNNDSTGL